jgi:hypothetical protein
MKYIAHRGLIDGPNLELENNPEHIIETLNLFYDCEVDLWRCKNEWWLGHDLPKYKVDEKFIGKQGLWLHCKNLDALLELSSRAFHYEYFWHQEDDFTLTSGNYIWTYPGKELTRNSISVQPEAKEEWWEWTKSCNNIAGVCTKYVKKFILETSTMSVGSGEKL